MVKGKGGNCKARMDTTTDTYGVRGAGQTWQASFGMALSEADLLFAARRDSLSNRIVFQFAHDVFDNWFEVEELTDMPDPDFNKAVQKVLEDLDAKSAFTQAAVFERIFGWSIIALTYVDYGQDVSQPVLEPRQIVDLIPFSTINFSVQSSDEDKDPNSARFGLPVLYTVRRGTQSYQTKMHHTRAIHLATRLLDHPYKGMSALEPVYDALTVLRNMIWGLGQTIFRFGSGFPDVTIEGAKAADLDKLEDSQQFKSLQARTYFLHNDKTTLDFKGAAGKALNPEPYYMAVMENISAGCGIPLALLRGSQAGQLTGSEVNEREYFKLVSDAQSRYEANVRELIDKLIECGQIRYKWNVNRGYRIKWLGGFEMNEKDKADVELRLAQARSWATDWKTVDEIRGEEGLPPMPNSEDGKKVLGLEGLRQKQEYGLTKSVNVSPSPAMPAGDSAGILDRIVFRFRGKKREGSKDSQD